MPIDANHIYQDSVADNHQMVHQLHQYLVTKIKEYRMLMHHNPSYYYDQLDTHMVKVEVKEQLRHWGDLLAPDEQTQWRQYVNEQNYYEYIQALNQVVYNINGPYWEVILHHEMKDDWQADKWSAYPPLATYQKLSFAYEAAYVNFKRKELK